MISITYSKVDVPMSDGERFAEVLVNRDTGRVHILSAHECWPDEPTKPVLQIRYLLITGEA